MEGRQDERFEGTHTLADGTRFDGVFLDGLNGHGRAVWPNGIRFDGMWVEGCYRDGSRFARARASIKLCVDDLFSAAGAAGRAGRVHAADPTSPARRARAAIRAGSL